MVTIPFYGTTPFRMSTTSVETMVGNIMNTPPTGGDFLFIVFLLITVIYMLSYIRSKK